MIGTRPLSCVLSQGIPPPPRALTIHSSHQHARCLPPPGRVRLGCGGCGQMALSWCTAVRVIPCVYRVIVGLCYTLARFVNRRLGVRFPSPAPVFSIHNQLLRRLPPASPLGAILQSCPKSCPFALKSSLKVGLLLPSDRLRSRCCSGQTRSASYALRWP